MGLSKRTLYLNTSIPISLIVFDGDDTLWKGLDGGYISGVDYHDVGRDDYTFHNLDQLHIQRNDGQRFLLFAEVLTLLPEIERRGVLISLASYNRPLPTYSALHAFNIQHYFHHPVVEWSNRKDLMIRRILQSFQSDGYLVEPASTLFIDDDHASRYRPQMAAIGVHFLQKGVDIQDLGELLVNPRFLFTPPSKQLLLMT